FLITMIYPFLLIPILRDTRLRKNQRITATPEGLTFEEGERRVESNWQEIMEIYVRTNAWQLSNTTPHVVVTREGTFDFTLNMQDGRVLDSMLKHRASQA